jgi:hypothetical protein
MRKALLRATACTILVAPIVMFSACGGDDSTGAGAPAGGAGSKQPSGTAGTGDNPTGSGSGGAENGSAGAPGSGGGGQATGSGGTTAGGAGTSAGGSVGSPEGGATSDAGFPGDTFLPWWGGNGYYAKWSKGPSSDASFFPIGVWLQSPPNAPRYKAVGVNLYIGLYDGPTDDAITNLSKAMIPAVCDFSQQRLNEKTLWAWLQPDEPDNAQGTAPNYMPCIPPANLLADYNKWKAADPNRPVWLGLGRGVSATQWGGRGTCTGKTDMYPDYAKAADILSFDIYPANGKEPLEEVPQGVDNLRMWSGYTKPVISDIEASRIDAPNPRPTPAQITSEIWMALVHGAAGIQYFCHRFTPTFSETDCLDDKPTADAMLAINTQITSLAPVLNTPSVGNGVTTQSSDSKIPVDTMLKRYQGATYLFAAEMRGGMATATFTLRDFTTGSVEVIGEQRTIGVKAGAFSDTFQSYGAHVYKVTR